MEIADSKKQSDLETLYSVSEKVTELYATVKRIADSYGYPKTNKAGFFSDCTDLQSNVYLLANWIISPSAQNLLPFIQSKHNHAFATLCQHLNDK